MGTIVLLLLIFGAIALYLRHLFKASGAQPIAANRASDKMADDPIREASQIIKAAMDKCTADHGSAVQSLLWLAGADGTISKQEARNVFRFCERQGTVLPGGTYDAIEYLNNGMKISTKHTASEALADLATLEEKPIQYRAAFIGAAHAICGGNKRISKAKQDFLDRANSLVEATA